MKRPTFSPKPSAPSVRVYLPQAIERARRLKPDEPATRSEVVDEIARRLPVPKSVIDMMRERASREDSSDQ